MEDIYISKNRRNADELDPVYYDGPAAPEPSGNGPRGKNRKKRRRFLKFIAAALAAVFIFSSSLVFLIASVSGYDRNDLKENKYVAASELKRSPLVTNVLLLGLDGKISSPSRSDSIMLLSLDFIHMKIKLVSFLRDSWVKIPSKNKKAKLNAACAYAGPQLAVDTIEYNFGADIDHYVAVDFNAFTQIIDKLGGVETEVTQKEARYINKTTRHTVESGENVRLNGEEALVYCRIRKLDSDYMRTRRQRKVVSALIGQAKKAGLLKLVPIALDVFPLIQTDMSPLEITLLAHKAGIGVLAFDIEQTRVPIAEHMKPGRINGQWAEKVDFAAAKKYLSDFIYTDKINSDGKNKNVSVG